MCLKLGFLHAIIGGVLKGFIVDGLYAEFLHAFSMSWLHF